MNIIYFCTYLDEDLSKAFGLPFSKAGLRKKQTIIKALRQKHQVDIVSTIPFKRFYLKIYRSFLYQSKNNSIHFPAFILFPIINLFFNTISNITYLLRLHKVKAYDVLVIYNYSYNVILPAAFLKLLFGIKIICQLEDGWAMEKPFYKNFFLKGYYNLASIICDGLITNSFNLVKVFNQENNCLIRGSVPERNSIITAKEIQKHQNRLNLLFSSSIDNVRGAELLINFLNSSDSEGLIDKIEINITGRGDSSMELLLSDAVKNYTRRGGMATYHGFVSDKKLESLVEKSNVLLSLQNPNLSFSDYCFPSKIVDYMAFGKAIITTKVSDLESHFDLGFTFIDYSVKSLNDAIMKFLSDNDSLDGTKYKTYLDKYFTIEKYSEQLQNVLIRCFEKKE